MSKIYFKKDNAELSNLKAEAQIVRDCFDSNVQGYLEQFPTESDAKFEYRRSPYISKFTNYVSSAINAMSGIALKKLPKVEDDDLAFLPRMIGDTMANIGCDGVGYLLVDAPRLESDNQPTNEPTVSYIGIGRVIGMPVKDMSGNVTEFVFQGDEEYENESGIIETRNYRKKLFIDESGAARGEKYIETSADNYELEDGGEWSYSFDGLPVIEIDILTADKHPYIDVAMMNLWLYNLESDERNIIHFICSPYVQFFGEVAQDGQNDGKAAIYIGADRARRFNDKTKEGIEIAEAQGTGVAHATNKIVETADTITRMSASVISSTNYKTATQAENAEAKSLGFLPFVVISIETAFNRAIEFMGLFRGTEYNGGVTMNKKFSAAEFNAAQLTFIRGLYDSGTITKETMIRVAKQADLIDPDLDAEDEIRIAEQQLADVI